MRFRPLWRLGVAAVAFIAITGTAGCAAVAVPGSPPLSPASTATADRSESPGDLALVDRMNDYVDLIDEGRDDVDVPGLAGITVDEDSGLVDLYWVGDPPPRVAKLVAEPPSGVSVVVHPAQHDVAAMVKALDDVSEKYGDYMHGGSPADDGSGIEIEQTAKAASEGPTKQEWERAAGMPVKTSVTQPAAPA